MDNQNAHQEPKQQAEPSNGGAGRGKVSMGTGSGDGSDSRGIIEFAQEKARLLGHNFVGTEQLLIALVRCVSGIAPRVHWR